MSKGPKDPRFYKEVENRYVNFAEDFLGLRLAHVQKEILRAIANHQRVIVMSGNGPGKSYAMAAAKLGFLMTNDDALVLGTSGSYSQYVDTMWKPLRSMFKEAKENYGLPGKVLGGENNPRLRIDDEWYAKVVSPKNPDELEGRHGTDVMIVIEEADKEYITDDHFDSAGSSVTDMNDRMVAVANPPKEESHPIYDRLKSDRWHNVHFSSFDAHNVLVDAGKLDADHIPGIVDLPTLADDWEAFNAEDWPNTPDDWDGVAVMKQRVEDGYISRETLIEKLRPGFEAARRAHEERTDLDERWYRRRAGVIPPDTASKYRPIRVADVQEAYKKRAMEASPTQVLGVGLDVARSGTGVNVLTVQNGNDMMVLDKWPGVDHNDNEVRVMNYLRQWDHEPEIAVDAQGEGSGLADRLDDRYANVTRFHAGEKAVEESKFYSRWGEGLYHLGKLLQTEGAFADKKLREELIACARVVEYDERWYKSREDEVLKATSKDKVKAQLGHSPDHLDSAMMAAWSATDETRPQNKKQRLVW